MTAILDAWGRPITKTEIEEIAAQPRYKQIMVPATQLFQKFDQNEWYTDDQSPFVIASDSGHISRDEEQADYSSTLVSSSPYANLNDRFAHKNPIAELNIPRDTAGLMTLSMRHASSNYLVSRAIRIKKNFALRNIEFLGSATTRDFYTAQFRRLKLWKILSYAFRYYWTTGRVVVYWGDERPVQRVTLLDPRFILVRRVLGKEIVFLKPDGRWKQTLEEKDNFGKVTAEAKFLKKNLPSYWLPYIMTGQLIPLKEESYALIENDLDMFVLRGIDAPNNLPLQPVFKELAAMEMLIAGDFSTAWMMKNMIALVSIGDPQHEKNYVRPDQGELQKLQAAFQRPEYALWAYVDPTVDVRFVSPDPKILSQDRYKQFVEAVEYCLGTPGFFSRDASGDFGSSSLSLKAFREEIITGRQDIEFQFFDKFLPVMREGFTSRKAGTKNPTVSYDLDCLKDDRVLMDELNSKYDRGGLSMQSLLEGKIHDYDTEIERKKSEQKDLDAGLLAPAYDPAHGYIDGQDGGRPPTGSRPQSESQTGRASRPSRSS